MKIGVIVLVMLGLLAAGSAVVVVQMLSVKNVKTTPTVPVVQSHSFIPALTVLKGEHLIVEKAPPAGLPQNYLSSPAQAIGKVLRVPIEEGQVLAQDYFVPEGTASDMIKLIPPGMLAYSVTLSRGSVNRYLLYPGCVVDIMAMFRLSSSAKGQAMTLTLLQNLQVIAIDHETVLSHSALEGTANKGRRGAGSANSFIVTFKVTPEEAKALQLASRYGGIAVALRNPTDTERRDVVAMILNQGQLEEWAQDLDPGALLEKMRKIIVPESETELSDPNSPIIQPVETSPGLPVGDKATAVPLETKKTNWKVILIQGQKSPEEINFSLDPNEAEDPNEADN